MDQNIVSYKNIKDIINNEIKGIINIPLCNSEKCGIEIEKLSKLTLLGNDLENNNIDQCIICKKNTNHIFYLSKKY